MENVDTPWGWDSGEGRCLNCGCYDRGKHNPGCDFWNHYEEPWVTWRGISFNFDEWEWGIGEAADRACRSACVVPRILIVAELIGRVEKPWWFDITVGVVRTLFRYKWISRPKRQKPPKLVTPGYYGLGGWDDEEDVPF